MIKIGILLKNFQNLENYELRIIKKIFDDNELKLSLIILDGRTRNDNPRSFKNRINRLIFSKNILGKLFYNIQYKVEKFLFRSNKSADNQIIINLLMMYKTL